MANITAISVSSNEGLERMFDEKVPEACCTWTCKFYSVRQCMDIYEKEFEDVIFNNVDDTNRYYGGYKLGVIKVVFPNGKVDPWHAIGVTQDLSPDATAIYIPGTAHCPNMYPATPSDPPELIAARQTIAKLIGKWIS